MGENKNYPEGGSSKDSPINPPNIPRKPQKGDVWQGGIFTKTKKQTGFIEKIVGPGKGSYAANAPVSGNGNGDDAAIKAARVAAIKKANLSNKIYNVSSDTSASAADPAVAQILYGGGGGGTGYVAATESMGFSLSDIPTAVWIILAVAGGWFLIKSSKGKGKLF